MAIAIFSYIFYIPKYFNIFLNYSKTVLYSRLTNNRLEKEKAELAHQVEDYKHHVHTYTSEGPAAGNHFQYLK